MCKSNHSSSSANKRILKIGIKCKNSKKKHKKKKIYKMDPITTKIITNTNTH